MIVNPESGNLLPLHVLYFGEALEFPETHCNIE